MRYCKIFFARQRAEANKQRVTLRLLNIVRADVARGGFQRAAAGVGLGRRWHLGPAAPQHRL